jgi:hypothetical protein
MRIVYKVQSQNGLLMYDSTKPIIMYKYIVKYVGGEHLLIEASTLKDAKSKALKSGLSPIISIIRKHRNHNGG